MNFYFSCNDFMLLPIWRTNHVVAKMENVNTAYTVVVRKGGADCLVSVMAARHRMNRGRRYTDSMLFFSNVIDHILITIDWTFDV